ncbi:MAG: hypothetical protein FDX30_04535 [Chlorobium sp.]|nr:MAG: hypothetical protein FDX30_04535 [Chlorobium sp.]
MSFENILRTQQYINTLSRSLIERPAFEDINVLHPDPSRPESGFIRATSWLYCLYFEAGRVSITYLRALSEANCLVDREASDMHTNAVQYLRTELHHNLGFADSDQEARKAAEKWRRKACGTALPHSDQQWLDCYDLLVNEATSFLKGIDKAVRLIEVKEGDERDQIISDWKRRLNRSWPAAQFDSLIEEAKYRLGRHGLDNIAFRKRHLDRWRKKLDLLEDGFNFEREATLIIEKTLLDDSDSVLPITGKEIMNELQIGPGQLVGKLLEDARNLYNNGTYGATEILENLRANHNTY